MKEETIIINGMTIGYKIVGQGPTILILHGWGSSSDRWAQVSELLSQRNFSVIVPDLPGFGKNSQPLSVWGIEEYSALVSSFVEKLGLAKFVLLGHSFGGGLAVKYASRHPEKVRKLILVASAIRRGKTPYKTAMRILAKIFKLFSFLPLYGFFRKALYKYAVRSDYAYQAGIMKEIYLKVINEDLSPLLSRISVPTLIVWGEKDDVLSVADSHFINKHIEKSKLVLIPHADHDIEQHMPEALVEKIKDYIQ